MGDFCSSSSPTLCCSGLPPIKESRSTKVAYCLILVLVTVVACLMLTPQFHTLLVNNLGSIYDKACVAIEAGHNCIRLSGYVAVYRLGFSVCCFSALLCIFTIGISSSDECRAGIHNGFWFVKITILVGICVAVFFIPKRETYLKAWMYVGTTGGAAFYVFQLILLVDFAHSLRAKWHGGGDARASLGRGRVTGLCFKLLGIFVTCVFFVIAIFASLLLIAYFARASEDPPSRMDGSRPSVNCLGNKIIIGFNILLCGLCAVISVLPCIQRRNRNAGLLQASIISVYSLYLTWSAISSVPDEGVKIFLNVTIDSECRPNYKTILRWGPFYEFAGYASLSLRQPSKAPFLLDENGEHTSPVVPSEQVDVNDFLVAYFGILLMLVMAVYSSLTTTRDSPRLGVPLNVPSHRKDKVCGCCFPRTREIYNSGYQLEEKYSCYQKQSLIRDEQRGVTYSYTFFHIVFILATLHIMMQLTNWYSPESALILKFNRTKEVVWVKISCGWMVTALYIWSLLYPNMLLPGRDFQNPLSLEVTPKSDSKDLRQNNSISKSNELTKKKSSIPANPVFAEDIIKEMNKRRKY